MGCPDWLKWLGGGLLLGGLLTYSLAARHLDAIEVAWLERREAVRAQLAAQADSIAAARAAEARADSVAQAAEAARLQERARNVRLAAKVASAQEALGAAQTEGDSLVAALGVIEAQAGQIGGLQRELGAVGQELAAVRARELAVRARLGLVEEQRDSLLVLVQTAPVGKKPPKLLGFIPMPEVVVGPGCAVASSGSCGLAVVAGYKVF